MKAGFIAAAAALAGSASAVSHRHGHKHEDIFAKRNAPVCSPGCTTIWTTIYGEATLYSPPQTATPTPSTTKAPAPVTTSAPIVVPTPIAQTCPTPGVYTFPATTVTLTETTTVCAATSTKVPSGTHTLGGVTTVVETATTVVCPYATVSTKSGGVVTSVIATTTYVCPSAGTYTIAPHTTTVTVSEEVVVYPVVTTYCPGTYTAPAVVTTVTETATVVYCPFTGTSTTAAPQAPAPVAPKPSTPAPPPATGGNKPAPGGSGDHWAITYTPYSSDTGSCKAPSEVMSDLQDLKNKGFTTVRVYSTDCDTLPNVGAACASLGLKMIIGVFVTNSGCSTSNPDITSQVSQITSWAQWNLVELIVIGNECVHNGFCSPADLQTLIVWVKSQVTGAGYTGTYTTAETVDVWQRSDMQAAICDVVDIVGGQIHAYFNAQTTPDQAGVFVKGQLDILDSDAICGGKQSLNLECGWPSECNCNGVACCGADNQSTAIASIREVIGSKVVFFSTHNDMWKSADTACGCEQFWGCSNLF